MDWLIQHTSSILTGLIQLHSSRLFNESQNVYLALLLFSRDENDELNKNKRPNPDPISCPIPEKAQKLDDIPCAE